MSEKVKSTSKAEGQKRDDQLTHPPEPVVAQQPSNEQPEQEQPPAEIQADAFGQEELHEEPAAEGPELEADLQEVERPKTGRERGDGPDVKGKRLLRLDYTKYPGSGEGPSRA
ncbi:PREDICTED: P antigen family member 3-like [Chinchilla lanigera]|uniref:P antigen family member 3-like n=1 Tax=Chinchilla lanigera TaxID=34839 RepID=UPI00038EA6FC|nr:PREDICTED: P antigen family member 3-like [Chinchilla lanigera]XP_005411406.1 PREDICTED: P antigen family member 3-like [Chinchilla lanigera]